MSEPNTKDIGILIRDAIKVLEEAGETTFELFDWADEAVPSIGFAEIVTTDGATTAQFRVSITRVR